MAKALAALAEPDASASRKSTRRWPTPPPSARPTARRSKRPRNCVVVAGKRAGEVRFAAALVLATTRADVNGVIKRRLDVRKASFAPMDEAVSATGMEYGGITPVGLPADWPILIDQRVADAPELVIGSGIRGSKLLISGTALAALPGAEVIEDLAK